MSGRLGLADISPVVACGAYPARAALGEQLPIEATAFRDGHGQAAATVVWRDPGGSVSATVRMDPGPPGLDRWIAHVVPDTPGRCSFGIETWADPYADWQHTVQAKVAVGQGADDLANDLELGARLMVRAARAVPKAEQARVKAAEVTLRDTSLPVPLRIAPALHPDLARLLHDHPVRDLVTRSPRYPVWVEPRHAMFGSWYEFFPRSTGGVDADGHPVHGTFATAAERLPAIAAMGFDVVYLPPVHPIGEVNRKGKNNSVIATADDVGSPWAIGSAAGGHDAVHPQLGTFADFDAFVARATELQLRVAIDLALQAAPDHPWAAAHPEWFTVLPDGSIAYAENPPKKYQDIYPINFDGQKAPRAGQPSELYAEILRVVRLWISHGVRIFRVDNPHTKPLNFWHWLIWEVKTTDPDIVFLAEAFTRPAIMHALARVGFTQSYTYFTWRVGKDELAAYGKELAAGLDHMWPNLFVNTPDILHASLQYGGPPAFAIRAVLASMLSPTWGVYSGYELYEHTAVNPGSEEYLDSEKYQLRPRDFAAAKAEGRSLAPFITTLNQLRRRHPALQQMRTLAFHDIDSDSMLAFSKLDPERGDALIVIVTLDPFATREAIVHLDMAALGMDAAEVFTVTDELSGATYHWGAHNYVRLDPHSLPAHVLAVHRLSH